MSLLDGRVGNVVLVGPRSNPKGAVVVLPGGNSGSMETLPFADVTDGLHPATIVEVLAAQERAFGTSRLQPLS